MSLVAYGSSDESDLEEINERADTDKEDSSNINTECNKNKEILYNNNNLNLKCEKNNDGRVKLKFESFSKLKLTTGLLENSLKILDKNRSQPIRIAIPSLSEIKKSTEDEKDRKQNKTRKPSGLLALLTPPKNEPLPSGIVSSNLDSVKTKSSSKDLVPRSVIKQVNSKDQKGEEEFVDEWDSGKSFFFNSSEDEFVEYQPIEPELNTDSKSNISIGFKEQNINYPNNQLPLSDSLPSLSNNVTSEEQTLEVDAEALEKLCGRSVRKRVTMDIQDQIIDVHADSLVGEANLWLTKDLTSIKPTSAKKIKTLSTMERKKHQITFLASQAKEKEMELRNQWANNRLTKKQTQSKYGF